MEHLTDEKLSEMICAGGEAALGAHDVLVKRAKAEGLAEGLKLSLNAVQEAVDLLRNNMRWVINSMDKEVLMNALMVNGWHNANPFEREDERAAVRTIAAYCGLGVQPVVGEARLMQASPQLRA